MLILYFTIIISFCIITTYNNINMRIIVITLIIVTTRITIIIIL